MAEIRLVGDPVSEAYRGKIEVFARYCSSVYFCTPPAWLAVCHDGSTDADHQAWDRTAAMVACRQLGYDGGWDEAIPGITTEISVEGVTCSEGKCFPVFSKLRVFEIMVKHFGTILKKSIHNSNRPFTRLLRTR